MDFKKFAIFFAQVAVSVAILNHAANNITIVKQVIGK